MGYEEVFEKVREADQYDTDKTVGEAGSRKIDSKSGLVRKSKSRTGTTGEFSTKLVNNISQLEQEIKEAKQVVVQREKDRALACQVKLCDHLAGVPLWRQVSLQNDKHKAVDLFALLASLNSSKVLMSTHKVIHIRDFKVLDSRGSQVQPTVAEFDQFEKAEEVYKAIDAILPKMINTKLDLTEGRFRLLPQASIKTGEGQATDAADLIEYKDQELRTTTLPCVFYLMARNPNLLAKVLCGADGLRDYSGSKKQVLLFNPEDQTLHQLTVSNTFLASQVSNRTFFFSLRDKVYWPLYLEKAAQFFDPSLTILSLRSPSHYFSLFTGCSVVNYQISRHSSNVQLPEKDKSILKAISESIKQGRMVAGKIRTWSNRNLW